MGFKIEDRILHSILFADEQIIFSHDYEEMEHTVRKVRDEKWGLKINFNKIEYIRIGRDAKFRHRK
jgi:hypothetical protein